MRGEFHSPNLQEEYFPGEQFGDFILGGSGDWYAMDRLMIVRLLMAVIVEARADWSAERCGVDAGLRPHPHRGGDSG